MSSTKKGKGKAKKKAPEVKLPRNADAKKETLFAMYMDYDDSWTKSKKIKDIARKTGLAEASIWRYKKLLSWDERVANLTVKHRADAVKESLHQEKGAVKEVAFSEVVSTIKDFSFVMLTTSRDMAKASAMMIQYHTAQITKVISESGGVNFLTLYKQQLIQGHYKEIARYKKEIGEYMHPNNIAKYLSLVGIEDAVGKVPDGVDETAFTPKAVQNMLKEAGLISTVGNEEQIRKIESELLSDSVALEEIDARKVVDEKNQINVEKEKRFKPVER